MCGGLNYSFFFSLVVERHSNASAGPKIQNNAADTLTRGTVSLMQLVCL